MLMNVCVYWRWQYCRNGHTLFCDVFQYFGTSLSIVLSQLFLQLCKLGKTWGVFISQELNKRGFLKHISLVLRLFIRWLTAGIDMVISTGYCIVWLTGATATYSKIHRLVSIQQFTRTARVHLSCVWEGSG